MKNKLGLRLEDKNPWERRVALTPDDVKVLVDQGVHICVERFDRRAFSDDQYLQAGALLTDNISNCNLVLGIKEMPLDTFQEGGAYMFFSHTIKGQPYNMAMLAKLIEKKCTLLDHEIVTNDKHQRLIFFGRFAGIAGMIDSLWTLGQRLKTLGHDTPFLDIKPAHKYATLEDAKKQITAWGKRLAEDGVPSFMAPMVIGITGAGHVSKGAQEIIDLLPHVEVAPDDLDSFVTSNRSLVNKIVKVIYQEHDLVEPKDSSIPFELQHYYDNGEAYKSKFAPHLKNISVLINAIYWSKQYPKLADTEQLKELFSQEKLPRLMTVGDITCDIDGSLACTMRDTEPGDPSYVYNPNTRQTPSGFNGPGLAVMAVGNLPCELPVESSVTFSNALTPFIPAMAQANLNAAFKEVELPEPIKRAVILWRGEFTPNYEYMKAFLP